MKQRKKKYPYRSQANTVVVHEPPKKPKEAYRDDPGGAGEEIVSEVSVCPTCALRHAGADASS